MEAAAASSEAHHAVINSDQGAFLLSPSAAVQARLDDLAANGEFLECPVREPVCLSEDAGSASDASRGWDSASTDSNDVEVSWVSDVPLGGPGQGPPHVHPGGYQDGDPPPGGPHPTDWSALDLLSSAALLSTAPDASPAAAASMACQVASHDAPAADEPAGGGGGRTSTDGGGATASSPRGGQGAGDDAAAAPAGADPAKPPVQLCFSMDKGGRTSTVKAFFGRANQRHPSCVGHSIFLGVFPCKTDDHVALEAICAVWVADIEELRANGVQVRGEPRTVQVILTGDYKWMTAFSGHSGACAGMLCLWCTAVARPTAKNAAMVKHFGCIQDASRYAGRPRDVAHAVRMCVRYAAGPNGSLVRPRALRRHLSIERRSLMVIAAMDVAPMPLHMTLGITIALMELAVEAVTFSLGETAELAFCTSMGEILRHDAGVSPAPYFGGTFEGRKCHRIGRKLGLVADLMDGTAPGPGAVARRRACSLRRGLLPTLNRADTVSDDEFAQFGTDAAAFVDGLKAGFAWFSVTPKIHVLCCHAAAFL